MTEEDEKYTIKLTLEEFEHLANTEPGACDCKICRRFWSAVEEWLEDIKKAHDTDIS